MGTCVPTKIIEALAENQPQINKLWLFTDQYCQGDDSNSKEYGPLDLSRFLNLRGLLWVGPREENFPAFVNTAISNRKHLRRLWLEQSQRQGQEDGSHRDGRQPYQFTDIAKWVDPEERDDGLFESLEQICLSYVFFGALSKKGRPAMNIGQPRSLILRDCVDWNDFVRLITESGSVAKLRRLELVDTQHTWAYDHAVEFVNTLKSGLVDLFLLVKAPDGFGPEVDAEFWGSLTQHQATLKRLVYHRVYTSLPVGDDSRFTFAGDDTALGIKNIEPNTSPLGNFNLECLGLSCNPAELVSRPLFAPPPTLNGL